MSGERLSPLDDSDYREIAEEIAEEMKEPDERLLSGEQPSPPDDSDYKAIAAEIESAPHMSPSGLWDLLSRYPVAWFPIGVIVVVIITVLFFERLCCVLEFRLTEAIVALIALLAVGAAGMTFSIAPPQIDKVLQSLYGGVAVTFIIVVMVMQFLPPPSREDCFPTQVPTLTATPTPTYTMTPTSTETPTNTPVPTPTPTLAARATRVWESVAILSPSEGEEVPIRTHVLR